ncbi:MAG: SMC-Scp complex subunit ScpB [Gammaproteobacteria bacterium]|nr:SMC-Scp complex subunit ScpB [Gammaproteobacteria bacterium]
MEQKQLKQIIEAALMAAGGSLKLDQLLTLFEGDHDIPTKDEVLQAIHELMAECSERGVELKEVSSGFRFQARQEFSQWVQRLWEEKPQRYSRALLETLALVAYRQPITRAEIEEVRGVSVSSQIMKTLQEREWVRVVGHRDVPGKPAMYATTKGFLDYFNMQGLDELPTLAEIRDIDSINAELAFDDKDGEQAEQKETVAEPATAEDETQSLRVEEAPNETSAQVVEPEPAVGDMDDESEAADILSDEEMKAIDALNKGFRDRISGDQENSEPEHDEALPDTIETNDAFSKLVEKHTDSSEEEQETPS